MGDRSSKKIFYLILLIGLSVFGIYMNFFYEPDKKEEETSVWGITESRDSDEMGDIENMALDMYDYSNKALPDVENETIEDEYSEGKNIEIYFENTEVLDTGSLPAEVHAKLTEAAQRYLFQNGYSDVTELYVDEESYTEAEEIIRFKCFMDGYEKKLQIEYLMNEKKLQFVVIKE